MIMSIDWNYVTLYVFLLIYDTLKLCLAVRFWSAMISEVGRILCDQVLEDSYKRYI